LRYLIWFNFFPFPCLRRNCNLQDLISFQTFDNAPPSLA
jgi:hypothetical protein